jgi:hypothetical protein
MSHLSSLTGIVMVGHVAWMKRGGGSRSMGAMEADHGSWLPLRGFRAIPLVYARLGALVASFYTYVWHPAAIAGSTSRNFCPVNR